MEAKEYLFNHIKNNKPQDKEDEEETLVRKEYEIANLDKINSVTIILPTNHVQAWRDFIEENYGKPIPLPVKLTPAPLQYKTDEGVAITSWFKERNNKSTIIIQGRTEYLKFAKTTLPKLFECVLVKIPKYLGTEERRDIQLT